MCLQVSVRVDLIRKCKRSKQLGKILVDKLIWMQNNMSFYNLIYFVQLNFYVNLDNCVLYFDWSKKLIADLVVCKNIQI